VSVINFKRIGQLVESVSRFQSNVEQAFKQVNECFASLPAVVENDVYYSLTTTTYSASTADIQKINNVPKGDYYIHIGCYYTRQQINDSCYMYARVNGDTVSYHGGAFPDGTTMIVGPSSWSGHSSEGGYYLGQNNSTKINLPNEFNSVNLQTVISAGSSISRLWFRLEKINKPENLILKGEWN